MTSTAEKQDRVESAVEINAPMERVWTLVSTPGWWLGEGADGIQDPSAATRDRYPVHMVESHPRDYCSFQWAPTTPGAPLTDNNSTLIEFFLAEDDGVVTVRVVESGFAALSVADGAGSAETCDNTTMITLAVTGWRDQLDSLRAATEAA